MQFTNNHVDTELHLRARFQGRWRSLVWACLCAGACPPAAAESTFAGQPLQAAANLFSRAPWVTKSPNTAQHTLPCDRCVPGRLLEEPLPHLRVLQAVRLQVRRCRPHKKSRSRLASRSEKRLQPRVGLFRCSPLFCWRPPASSCTCSTVSDHSPCPARASSSSESHSGPKRACAASAHVGAVGSSCRRSGKVNSRSAQRPQCKCKRKEAMPASASRYSRLRNRQGTVAKGF
jgi:hypothetical protein